MKKIICLIIMVCGFNSVAYGANEIQAGVAYEHDWTLYVNDAGIGNIPRDLLPLRDIFESLNATVTWLEDTGSIRIEYKTKSYLCEMVPSAESIVITDEQRKLYIQLNPTGINGDFVMKNDKIYLHGETMEYLIKNAGAQIFFDHDKKEVRIQGELQDKRLYTLYINDSIVGNIEQDLFPLREVFESLGATVTWLEDTEKVRIEYKDKCYLCEMVVPNDMFPEQVYIIIIDEQTEKYLQLNPMAGIGGFEMIDDRICLYGETMEYLIKNVGGQMYVDDDSRIAKIWG